MNVGIPFQLLNQQRRTVLTELFVSRLVVPEPYDLALSHKVKNILPLAY